MTLEELHSLSEDETTMLWFMINKIHKPALLDIELEPKLFTSINKHWLIERILSAEGVIKPEHMSTYVSLKSKLGLNK